MKLKKLLLIFFLLPISCMAKKESEFEKMLAGFPECKFENLYVDYKTHEPQHQYFKERGLMPNKVENEAAFFNVNEKFHGMPVDEIVISAGYTIVSIRFVAPPESVEQKMRAFLKNGYNKEPLPAGSDAAMLTPLLKRNITSPQKTNLTCDFEANY